MAMVKHVTETAVPVLQFSCSLPDQQVQASQVLLPVLLNKVVESASVSQMSPEAFKKNWDELSSQSGDAFLRADVIMKNPAPAHVPPPDVLKQVAQFTRSCLNLHVLPPTENGSKI